MQTDGLTATLHDKMDEWCFIADDALLPAWWQNSLVSRTVISNCFSQLHINHGGTVGGWAASLSEVPGMKCVSSCAGTVTDADGWQMKCLSKMDERCFFHCIYNTIDEPFLLCAWWEWHQMDIDLAVSVFLCGACNQDRKKKSRKSPSESWLTTLKQLWASSQLQLRSTSHTSVIRLDCSTLGGWGPH